MPHRFVISLRLPWSLHQILKVQYKEHQNNLGNYIQILYINGHGLSSSSIKYLFLPCSCDYDSWPPNLMQTTFWIIILHSHHMHILSWIRDNYIDGLRISVGHNNSLKFHLMSTSHSFSNKSQLSSQVGTTLFIYFQEIDGVNFILFYVNIVFESILKLLVGSLWEDLSSKPLDYNLFSFK